MISTFCSMANPIMTQKPSDDKSKGKDPLNPVRISGNEPRDQGKRESKAFPFRPSGNQQQTSAGAKRRDLARLLWGEDDHLPQSPAKLEPVKLQHDTEESARIRVRPADDTSSAMVRRASLRRQCSFPGLLRVLIPEVSFQPRTFAVRLVDISPHGARLETRQLTDDHAKLIGGEKRHVRLEALVPTGKQILPGHIAWVDHRENVSYFGIHFEQDFHGVDELFTKDFNDDSTAGIFALASPKIGAFSSVTSKRYIKFQGASPGATHVEVRRGDESWMVQVVNDTFELEVPLHEGRSNFLNFFATREGIKSVPTPVCVVHREGVRDTNTVTKGALLQSFDVDIEGGQISIELAGSPRRYFQALRLLEKSLQYADHVELRFDFTGDAEKAEKILKALTSD